MSIKREGGTGRGCIEAKRERGNYKSTHFLYEHEMLPLYVCMKTSKRRKAKIKNREKEISNK